MRAFEMGKTSKKYDIKRLLRNNNNMYTFWPNEKKQKLFDNVAIEN